MGTRRMPPLAGALILGAILGGFVIMPAVASSGPRATLNSVRLISHQATVAGNDSTGVDITCPSGYRTLGGGVDARQPNGGFNSLQVVIASYPTKTGWTAEVQNNASGPRKFRAWDVCGRLS